MARKRKAAKVAETKAPKTYRLAASRIARARAILGTPSDTATIEMALDLVSFREELLTGVRAMRGARVARFDDE